MMLPRSHALPRHNPTLRFDAQALVRIFGLVVLRDPKREGPWESKNDLFLDLHWGPRGFLPLVSNRFYYDFIS